jgi:hypothetical protein
MIITIINDKLIDLESKIDLNSVYSKPFKSFYDYRLAFRIEIHENTYSDTE